tara:strand:- start:5385 stop:5756 length:372 start_codon:yes stop_codon:yes gene_type:complete
MTVKENVVISKEMIKSFIKVVGDNNPLHWDEEFCKSTNFKKPIAHGALLTALFSKLIATKFPGKGSIYLSQSIEFKKPCFIGDEISVNVKLIKKEGNKYFLSTYIKNSQNELLLDGKALVLNK